MGVQSKSSESYPPAYMAVKYSGAPKAELLRMENAPSWTSGETTNVYQRSLSPTPTHVPLALSNRLSLTLPTSCIEPAGVYFNVVTRRVRELTARIVCLDAGPSCSLSIPESWYADATKTGGSFSFGSKRAATTVA